MKPQKTRQRITPQPRPPSLHPDDIQTGLMTIIKAALALSAGLLLGTASTSAAATEALSITRSAGQLPVAGPASSFSGHVRIEQAFAAQSPARVGGALVTFEPGSRTAWHTHPLGQILIVTSGVGWVQEWGNPIHEIRPGDIVWIPPNIKHWHGASSTSGMSHLAIAEKLDGKSVSWLEQVSEEQYLGDPILRP